MTSVWANNPQDPSWDRSGEREGKGLIKPIPPFLWEAGTERLQCGLPYLSKIGRIYTNGGQTQYYSELHNNVHKCTGVESAVIKIIVNQQIFIKTPVH